MVLKESRTLLRILSAIDGNDTWNLSKILDENKIDVNSLYALPSVNIPNPRKPMHETFLHRALRKKSEYVFGYLLRKGANPKIKGHFNSSVVEDLFDGDMPRRDTEIYGRMLIDAGITPREILEEIMKSPKIWNQSENPYLKNLVHYADTLKTKIAHRRVVKIYPNGSEHIRN